MEVLQGKVLIQDLIVLDVRDGKKLFLIVKGRGEPAVFGVPIEDLECTQVYYY